MFTYTPREVEEILVAMCRAGKAWREWVDGEWRYRSVNPRPGAPPPPSLADQKLVS